MVSAGRLYLWAAKLTFFFGSATDALYYRQASEARVPVKWMAPEAVLEARYTVQSDVWSFGVLAWEVYSFAMTPYGNLSGADLVSDLRQGYLLPQPPVCPDAVYALLLRCWAWDPVTRPAAGELGVALAAPPTRLLESGLL